MDIFRIENKGHIQIIHMPPKVDDVVAKAFISNMEKWFTATTKIHVLNFGQVHILTVQFYKAITLFNSRVKSEAKAFGSINLSLPILAQIKGAGMELLFSIGANISDLCTKHKIPPPPKVSIDANFIQPFILATKEILDEEAHTNLKPLSPFLKTVHHSLKISIIGIIYLVSERFKGSIQISFPQPVILKLYEKAFEEKCDSISLDTQYFVGDITAKVLKKAKTDLENKLKISITDGFPSVILCDDAYKEQMSNQITLVLPFDSEFGKFLLEITTDEMSYSQAKPASI